ncbi:DUF7380 domain-containing protein [Microbulbifer rhizosphaerae]|uniref:Tetratricopeptide (TPR) repeat protein n=1 Tax=Microbulbifer rhizosphaerae TaxID=1562603 RepID=A0A7W4ZBJ9_9GAMM|nr:hypothetical protein [Microbulbifer rhizosphaerae]MBB3063686.1 tetratricopeptide (TPR) repeat protein [Microbulbifer rhizosphaerae]
MSKVEDSVNIVNEIVFSARKGECTYCHGEILARARNSETPAEISEYLKPIGEVASYHFRQSDTLEPFGPMFQSSDGRSAAPSDLCAEDLNRLREVLPHIESLEVKARICDVLWLRERKPDDAKSAIHYYIDVANDGFDLDHWTFAAECVERALRLASLLRRKEPLLCQSVADILLGWLNDHSESDQKFLTARSISLLLQFGYGDPGELHKQATRIAEIAQQANDHHRAEEYWRLAVEAARSAGDQEGANWAQTQLAESYVSCARGHASSGMVAAHWMQKAVESYKAVPGSKVRREELYQELLEFQNASLAEMGRFEYSVDVTDVVKASVELMEDLSATDALFKLAFRLSNQPSYDKLRAQALELAQKHPLSSLFGAVHLDREGKVVARSEGSFGSDDDGVSDREIFRLVAQEHQFIVIGQLVPAIDVLVTQHAISEQDMLAIVANNPFVESGQERLYAKALWSGLNGADLSASV